MAEIQHGRSGGRAKPGRKPVEEAKEVERVREPRPDDHDASCRDGEEIEREQRMAASCARAMAARAAAQASPSARGQGTSTSGRGRTSSERHAGGERAAVAVSTGAG